MMLQAQVGIRGSERDSDAFRVTEQRVEEPGLDPRDLGLKVMDI